MAAQFLYINSCKFKSYSEIMNYTCPANEVTSSILGKDKHDEDTLGCELLFGRPGLSQIYLVQIQYWAAIRSFC